MLNMSEPTTLAQSTKEVAEVVESTGGIGMLGINAKIFLAQLVNFVIVLLVLWRWAYRPIIALLDERSKRIEKSVQQAKEIEARFVSTQAEQEKLIASAKGESAVLVEHARAQSEKQKNKMTAAAKEEVKKVVAQGKVQLQNEKAAMIQEAKTELVELAVAAASKILQEHVDEKKAQKLAQEVLEKI